MSARYLLAALLSLGSLSACIDEDIINPMSARQPRVDPYKKSSFFADGMTMRKPPAGTVPRERLTLKPAITAGKVRAADGNDHFVTSIPLPVDEKFMKLGRKHYNITCGTCHGPLGDGDSIVATQMALKPPPSLIDFRDRPVGYIFDVATRGHGLMAAYEAELPVRERWAVVAYIRALQVAGSQALADIPPAEAARLQQEAAK